VDPDKDPVPAFQVNPDPDTDPVQKIEEKTAEFLYIFFDQNCNSHIPRPSQRLSKLQEKPSAFRREHPALQMMKLINCFLLFYTFLGHFCPPGSGSGFWIHGFRALFISSNQVSQMTTGSYH